MSAEQTGSALRGSAGAERVVKSAGFQFSFVPIVLEHNLTARQTVCRRHRRRNNTEAELLHFITARRTCRAHPGSPPTSAILLLKVKQCGRDDPVKENIDVRRA